MPRHTLFAYVDGSDLDDIADALEERPGAFVDGRRWVAGEARVVNQQQAHDESCTQPEDIRGWDQGSTCTCPTPAWSPQNGCRCRGHCALPRHPARRIRPEFRHRHLPITEPEVPRMTCTALSTARPTWRSWQR